MKLTSDDIYVGTSHWPHEGPAYVFGWQFGPVMLAVGASLEEAFDEWDERHGTRVNWEEDKLDLADYGSTPEEQVEKAMGDGDIRVNGGGTTVWVDHYEWVREFPTAREAGAYFQGGQ